MRGVLVLLVLAGLLFWSRAGMEHVFIAVATRKYYMMWFL